MKKQIFIFAVALVLVCPTFSFKNFEKASHADKMHSKQSIIELGQFTRDGYTYAVYVNDATNTITGVMYTEGFGWYDVYSFSNGVYNPSLGNYVAHLRVYRTSTSGSFTFTGYVSPSGGVE